jgi:hypothetical protein
MMIQFLTLAGIAAAVCAILYIFSLTKGPEARVHVGTFDVAIVISCRWMATRSAKNAGPIRAPGDQAPIMRRPTALQIEFVLLLTLTAGAIAAALMRL